MSTYPPPPDYNAATGGGFPPPPTKDGQMYTSTVPPTRILGGSQYVEVSQSEATGFINAGYNHGVPTGGYPQEPPAYARTEGTAWSGQSQPPPAQGLHLENQPMENPDAESAGWTSEENFTGRSFSDKAIRRSFIRKVYLILMAQLLVTFGIICFFVFHQPTRDWIRYSGGSYFYYCAYAVFIVTYIALVCCPTVRRKTPGNYICLSVFTLAFSYMAATLSCFHDTSIVMIAVGITAAVCLAISIFACQTKIDFTLCSGLLFAGLMVLFFFGLACLIVWLVFPEAGQILNCVYAGLGALLFSLFLAYDTQMLIGGRQFQLEPEEYIFGALQLYMDVVYIFIFIMGLAGGSSSN